MAHYLKTAVIAGLLISPINSYCATAPLSLADMLDYALANNPELAMMQTRIEQAQTQLTTTLSSYYPNIKLGVSYQYSDNPAEAFAMIIAQRRLNFNGMDFNHPSGVNNFRPQISASYSLFRGGQDYHSNEAAKLGIEATQLEKSAVRNQLINSITTTYYAQLAAQAEQEVTLRAIEAVQSELNQSELKYQAGTVLKSDVLSLQVQLAQAKEEQLQAANSIELAKSLLKTLLGLSANDSLIIKDSLNQALPKNNVSFTELLNQAITQHPQLKAAEQKVAIARQQLAAAKGAYLPRADAMLAYGSNSQDFEFNSNKDNVSVGVQVEVDVFNGFATQAKVKKAEQEVLATQQALTQTRLSIENEVKTAQLKLQDALNRAEVASVGVQAAEEALRLVSEQRKAGVVTVTRYLEAEVARDKAHNREINARFDALRAQADVKQAIGAGAQ
ncbi:MAG: TolC family protein [Methylococcaceae bacterium]